MNQLKNNYVKLNINTQPTGYQRKIRKISALMSIPKPNPSCLPKFTQQPNGVLQFKQKKKKEKTKCSAKTKRQCKIVGGDFIAKTFSSNSPNRLNTLNPKALNNLQKIENHRKKTFRVCEDPNGSKRVIQKK